MRDLLLGRALTVQPLRSSDPAASPITGARIEPATSDGGARLDVVVPPAQPPGTYVGVIVDDESGRFAGTVRVTVFGAKG